MFDKTKAKINLKMKMLKKAAFLAFIGYVYDKVAGRKDKKKFVEDVEFEVEKKDVDKLK